MIRLAIDTAGSACQVALATPSGETVGRVAEMQRGHAEAVLPMVAGLCAEAGLSPAGLDQILVTTGPGSFTGVRIGLAAVAGLVAGRPIRVVGVDQFAAIAASVAALRPDLAGRPLLVAVDSRRKDVFAALFDADGGLRRGPEGIDPEELAPTLPADCVLAGDAAPALSGRAPGLVGSEVIRPDLPALLDRIDPAAGASGRIPEPLYIRPPDVTLPAP